MHAVTTTENLKELRKVYATITREYAASLQKQKTDKVEKHILCMCFDCCTCFCQEICFEWLY